MSLFAEILKSVKFRTPLNFRLKILLKSCFTKIRDITFLTHVSVCATSYVCTSHIFQFLTDFTSTLEFRLFDTFLVIFKIL